jgi:hypothetical protein
MTEAEIRNALIFRLAATNLGADAAFISEMFVDGFNRRADLIMANGKLAVFEIKSQHDSLVRLEGQLKFYEQFFEQVTVVCAEKHHKNVEQMTSEKIGIWVVKDNGELSVVRLAKSTALTSVKNWLTFLPVDELRELLKQLKIKATGARENLMEAAANAPIRAARSYVLDFLHRRPQRLKKLREQRLKNRSSLNTDDQKLSKQRLHQYIETLSLNAPAVPRRRI